MAKKKRTSRAPAEDESSDTDLNSSGATPKRKKVKDKEKESPAAAPKSHKKKVKVPVKEESKEAPPKPTCSIDLSKPYTIPLKKLDKIITCGLCKGYLIDATTIVECLHTFCKSCLLSWFEDDNNKCPECHEVVHQSHPTHYVAHDRTLQDMVYKLVPGLYEKELEMRESFVRDQKKAAGENIEEEERIKEMKRQEAEKDITNRCFEGKPKISHHRNEPQMLIELIRGAEDLPVPSKRFIRCGEMCTITTLKRYLSHAMYGTKSRYMEMDIFCNGELMGRDFSMKFIHLTRCRRKPANMPLRLVYKHRLE